MKLLVKGGEWFNIEAGDAPYHAIRDGRKIVLFKVIK